MSRWKNQNARQVKEQGTYVIESKDIRVIIDAPNKQIAWREFFARVKENGWARQLGMIAVMKPPTWKSEDDNVGMRTYPVLWKMKLIDWDSAVTSLAMHLETSKGEAEQIMSESAEKDAWAVPAQAVDLEHDWKGRRIA